MKIRINSSEIDVSIEPKDLIQEMLENLDQLCWCAFDRDRELYKKLVKKIQERLKQPLDTSCIE
jgi:predicted house-cleaning noncanonical NTP pyrophosphatase (MazG superfamily)